MRPHEAKLTCLTNADGRARLQHPLSPAVRIWYLVPLKIKELVRESARVESLLFSEIFIPKLRLIISGLQLIDKYFNADIR